MSSRLRALTLDLGPVDPGAGGTHFPHGGLAGALEHPDALCWIRRGEGHVGFGDAARFTAKGPDRFIEAEAWWKQLLLDADVEDEVRHPGTGPLAFGSFAFSRISAYESRLIVPELVVGVREGRAWATQLTADGSRPTRESLRAAVGHWTAPRSAAGSSSAGKPGAANGTHLAVRPGSLGEQRWMAAVASGVRHIRAGELEKLVLARDVVVEDDGGIPRALVLRRLASAYRDCWVYGVDGLVGATPEMLIQVEGRTAQARVLAGTLDRRDADGAGPGYAERVLAGSPKQRHEHQIAIESLTTALEPFAEALNAHDEPFILELPNVFHLASDVKAELAEIEGHVPTPLALVNALHPTAAVCGTPTQVAGELIRELEELDRGPYAGPVGWLDGAGNGEFGIALRGGVIEGTTAARLYAGCGIVDGSSPESELAETWAKFRPMLEALGVER
ncbi:isochorismate synthase [Sinomonas sp. JGH33]|uniref:isochorismate synthase n=1 Tax=Sinomonas terricola TaxID=3110330 RepID=A0ABU5T1X4_9MICC|nr:isochorismate synthase [Sinomonas sp. JGH33]MEA5453638.1 isochorismate synthase [Sinomonas sp. JGH33]